MNIGFDIPKFSNLPHKFTTAQSKQLVIPVRVRSSYSTNISINSNGLPSLELPKTAWVDSMIPFFICFTDSTGNVKENYPPLTATFDPVYQRVEDFHKIHKEIFAINDPDSIVEMVSWTVSVSCKLRDGLVGRIKAMKEGSAIGSKRKLYFEEHGDIETPIQTLNSMDVGKISKGPAIIETPFTTIVVDPPAQFLLTENRSIIISP